MEMWGRVLTLCTVLLIKESFAVNMRTNRTYDDFFFWTTYSDQNVTWMMMPDDSGLVVSAVIDGVAPIQTVGPKEVEFWFWNRKTGKDPIIVPSDSEEIDFNDFIDIEKTTKIFILIHGFTNTFTKSPFLTEVAEALLEQNASNVIGINWSKLATIPWYGRAVNNSAFVGCIVGKLIQDLRALESPQERIKVHIVAHNLGALVAGTAGDCVGGRKIERITGLDPPEILTTALPKSKKLDKDDADLVEIVHTSGNYIGINGAVGHRDFYANSGKWPQPGCMFDIADRCSVRRAYWYYKEAIRHKNSFKATKCPNYLEYIFNICRGNPTLHLFNDEPAKLTGTFYFTTNAQPPYRRD